MQKDWSLRTEECNEFRGQLIYVSLAEETREVHLAFQAFKIVLGMYGIRSKKSILFDIHVH